MPENPNFFTKNDPNNRKATVVINGEIITGTDIDQRVAQLVELASGAERAGVARKEHGGRRHDPHERRVRLQLVKAAGEPIGPHRIAGELAGHIETPA